MELTLASETLRKIVKASSQLVVAQAIGVRQQTVSQWIRGENRPRGNSFAKIQEIYKISVRDWYEPAPKPVVARRRPLLPRHPAPPRRERTTHRSPSLKAARRRGTSMTLPQPAALFLRLTESERVLMRHALRRLAVQAKLSHENSALVSNLRDRLLEQPPGEGEDGPFQISIDLPSGAWVAFEFVSDEDMAALFCELDRHRPPGASMAERPFRLRLVADSEGSQ